MDIFNAVGDIFGSVFGCLLFLVLGCCFLSCAAFCLLGFIT